MSQRGRKCVKHSGAVYENNANGSQDDDEVPPNFFHSKCFFNLTKEKIVVSIEVDAEKDHEDCDNPISVIRVACDGISFYSEAACSRGCNRRIYRIKNRHSADKQKYKLQNSEPDVETIQNLRGCVCFRQKLFDLRTGRFRFQNVHHAHFRFR